MNKFLFSLILVLMFCGCVSASGGKNRFFRSMDYNVGRNIELSHDTPIKISSHNKTQDRYLFDWENGCSWVYYVNKETKIVESWEYVSSPDKCSMGVGWFGAPW
jgi:hypothetical protein